MQYLVTVLYSSLLFSLYCTQNALTKNTEVVQLQELTVGQVIKDSSRDC